MNGTTTLGQKFLVFPWISVNNLLDSKNKVKEKDAWDKSIQVLRKEISNSWQGPNSVEEIRNQRIKTY